MKDYIIIYEHPRGEYNETTFLEHSCEPEELIPFLKKEGLLFQFDGTWDARVYEIAREVRIVVNDL